MKIKATVKKRIAGLAFILFYLALLFAMFFVSAGKLDFPSAWISLSMYSLTSIINVFTVDPELISERLQLGGEKVNRKDQILASISYLFLFPTTIIVAGLDLGRFGWTQSFPVVIQIIGLILYVLGNLFSRWAMANNRYFSTFVRIQKDRGHVVETGGPYQFVRHPGYAGAILAAIVLPLALGSVYAIAPALIGCVGFIIRTNMEDNQLKSELAGYPEYANKVKYRLLPWVW